MRIGNCGIVGKWLAETRTFTTHPRGIIKRGHDIIRDRCIATIEALKQDGFCSEAPLHHAIKVFEDVTGKHDRTTIKAYFGRLESQTKRVVGVTKQYIGRDTKSERRIIIRDDISIIHGYFETINLAHLEKRRSSFTGKENVFFVLHETMVVPEISTSTNEEVTKEVSPPTPLQESNNHDESLCSLSYPLDHELLNGISKFSIDNLSLNTMGVGTLSKEDVPTVVGTTTTRIEERERV